MSLNACAMICVSISGRDQIGEAVSLGTGLLELRLDLIGEKPADLYREIPAGTATIATCRPGNLSDGERMAMLGTCLELGASWIDAELDSPESYLEELRSRIKLSNGGMIVSHHDFEATPGREELVRLMERCYERGGVIAKIATMVNSARELLDLLSLYDRPGKKVVIGMGETGRIARIMAPYLGSEFTFASVGEQRMTAPGQLTVSQLKEIYKVIDKP